MPTNPNYRPSPQERIIDQQFDLPPAELPLLSQLPRHVSVEVLAKNGHEPDEFVDFIDAAEAERRTATLESAQIELEHVQQTDVPCRLCRHITRERFFLIDQPTASIEPTQAYCSACFWKIFGPCREIYEALRIMEARPKISDQGLMVALGIQSIDKAGRVKRKAREILKDSQGRPKLSPDLPPIFQKHA